MISKEEANQGERLARIEGKISILGAIATAALGLNCAVLGAVIVLLVK